MTSGTGPNEEADLVTNIMATSALDPIARIDPHPRLKRLREEAPILHDEENKSWLLSEYQTVRQFVNDRTLHRHPKLTEEGALVRNMVDPDEVESGRTDGILFLDEPDHSRVRLPLAKAFYSRINAMKDEIVGIVDDVIESVPAKGPFDLMSQIAVPVPILVIAKVLGIDMDRVAEFREWSEAVILSLNPLRSAEETAKLEWGGEKLEEQFTQLMADRRAVPRDDLISDLITLQAEGADLSDEEIRTNLGSLLIGGNLTTTDLIGNGVWLLLSHPEQYQKLCADPDLVGPAVEEILRFESPVTITTRVIPDEREVGGCPMQASQSVFSSLHSANRDPAVFEDPEAFNIERPHVPHVAFGGGSHICIGAPLARLEAKQALLRICQRFPDLTLADQDIQWRSLPFFRGIETLTVIG